MEKNNSGGIIQGAGGIRSAWYVCGGGETNCFTWRCLIRALLMR